MIGKGISVAADMAGKAYTYFRKAVCEYIPRVWHAINDVIDKIPTPVKYAVGIVGGTIAVASGAAPIGVVVGTLVGSIMGGAAMNAAIYTAGTYITNREFNVREMFNTALDGAADGALFAGAGFAVKGIGTFVGKNIGKVKGAIFSYKQERMPVN